MNMKKENSCKHCQKEGVLVPAETVKNLVFNPLKATVTENTYYLCMDKKCPTTYFNNNNNVYYYETDLKVPLWFKKNAHPAYACYCNQVTKEDVLLAIRDKKATTVKAVVTHTDAMKNPNCLLNNPLGKCCHPIIQEILDDTLDT